MRRDYRTVTEQETPGNVNGRGILATLARYRFEIAIVAGTVLIGLLISWWVGIISPAPEPAAPDDGFFNMLDDPSESPQKAQPDLGNALALIILTMALAYLAGAPPLHMGAVAAAALPVVVVLVAMKPYRWRRMVAFMNPWNDPQGSGFQIIQSFLALGSGGWLGLGLGESKQKLFYLPEPYTDFIFAIIGEELGLVGAVLVVALFALLIWRGLRIGLRAPDPFGSYLALGLTIMLATQTLVNLGVVTGALPTKGLPLPFISFGGSALLMTMFSAGVLLNISQHASS